MFHASTIAAGSMILTDAVEIVLGPSGSPDVERRVQGKPLSHNPAPTTGAGKSPTDYARSSFDGHAVRPGIPSDSPGRKRRGRRTTAPPIPPPLAEALAARAL